MKEKTDDDAIAHCLIAFVETSPQDTARKAELRAELGKLYKNKGMHNESIIAFLQAVTLDESQTSYWAGFADAIKYAEFIRPNLVVSQTIISAFSRTDIDKQQLAVPALSLLKLTPFYGSKKREALEDPLLLCLLEHTIIPDITFERWMTTLRHDILIGSLQAPIVFIKALAGQCALNEYIYSETNDETSLIDRFNRNNPAQNIILACYRPFFDTAKMDQRQTLAARIPSIKPISNPISRAVKQQYEENPYPCWTSTTVNKPLTIKEHLRQLFPNSPPLKAPSAHPNILIAGCGTGKHAIDAAIKYANSRVLGVDLSRQSLAYALQKTDEMSIKNLSFIEGDILDVKEIGQTFDLIECSGVLHHMQDPEKGLEALKEVLRDGGIMAIGLYSEIARRDVVAARRFIEESGFMPTLKGIRECRDALKGRQEFNFLTQSVDFHTTSACRDLLFHVQEHRFTLLQISTLLKRLDLKVIGLEIKDLAARSKYLDMHPEDAECKDLEQWHAYEIDNPHTFIGMYHLWLLRD